jgi:hypothetical protein
MDWLCLIRLLTQYVAPGLAAVVVVAEIVGWLLGAPVSPSVTHTYNYLLLIVFSLLTAIMTESAAGSSACGSRSLVLQA